MPKPHEDELRRTIWIVDHYAVPPGVPGFVRQHDHASYLAKRGWNSRIFASSYNHKAHRYERPTRLWKPAIDLQEHSIDFTWVHATKYTRNNWQRYISMVSFLVCVTLAAIRRPRPDIVMGASPHLLAALAGWLIAKRHRVPFVMEVQDLWPTTLIQLGLTNRVLIKVLRGLERFLYQQADAILTLADGISDGVAEQLGERDKVTLVPNGATVKQPLADKERQAIRTRMGWEDRFVAIWAGQHGVMNNLEQVIAAAKLTEDLGSAKVLYALVGDGPEKKKLMNMGAGVSNLQFLDPVSNTEIDSVIQAADVGLMIYRDFQAMRGARPTKMSEYMALQMPIVNNLQGEAAKLIDEAGVGMTVPPSSPSELAHAVIDLSNDVDRCKTYSSKGPAFVRSHLDREMIADRLADVLDRVCGQPT